ncbi:MAG TPA: hypothetical protein VH796_18930 [Nitrososphaeraceae archaeon]|jgi:hypothetical protein
MGTKQSQIGVGFSVIILLLGASIAPTILTPVMAQLNSPKNANTSMSSVMMESVRMHLKAADKAMSAGNASAALEQMNMARMQISVMGMKNMGVMNQSQAMQFMEGKPTSMKVVPENCIVLNDGTLECRDSLTNSYSFLTQ